MDEEPLSLDEQLKRLQRERHERKATVLARARAALATAREDIARGVDVDAAVIADLERSIAEYERYTLERPGLPPDA
jgi:ribosome-binding protein aMBF1 (putative translation factor)